MVLCCKLCVLKSHLGIGGRKKRQVPERHGEIASDRSLGKVWLLARRSIATLHDETVTNRVDGFL